MKHALSFVLGAALAALPIQAQAWDTIETFGGAWDTNWGETWAFDQGGRYEGYYEEDNGRFELDFTGHVFEGYWAEDMADQRCSYPVLGSYYWGRLELANSNSYPGIQMYWGYCEGPLERVWSFYERLPDGL